MEAQCGLTDQPEPMEVDSMITFDMAVDEEIIIPGNGRKADEINFEASQSGEEMFWSAKSASYPHPFSESTAAVNFVSSGSVEPVMTDIDMGGNNVSKESIPEPQQETERRKSITEEGAVKEIDPIGLIAFDSPSRFSAHPTATSLRSAVSCAQLNQPVLSLLDVDIMASPQSMAKYSQRDFELVKGEFEKRAEKQAEFLQFEIQTIQEKYDSSLQANNELRILMAEYENTMNQILEARKHKSDQLATIEQLLQDKRKLQVDLHTAQVSYQNLHSRYEEVKSLNEQLKVHEQNLKANIANLQAELTNADRRFEALRQHAEQKLSEANQQIQKVQSSMDVELSATKAKLLKAELRIASLEESLESKTRENKELGAICDELIQKIDTTGSSRITVPLELPKQQQ